MCIHPLQAQPHQLAQRELALAIFARVALVRHAGLVVGQLGDQAAHIGLGVLDLPQLVEDAPVHQAEVARVGLLRGFGDAVQEAIEGLAQSHHQPALAPLRAQADDHVMPLAPQADEVVEDAGRVLEIAVDLDRCIAPGHAVTGQDGPVEAEIARETDHLHAFVGMGEL